MLLLVHPTLIITEQWHACHILVLTPTSMDYYLHMDPRLLFSPRWWAWLLHEFHCLLIISLKMNPSMSMPNNIMGFLGEGNLELRWRPKTSSLKFASLISTSPGISMHWTVWEDPEAVSWARRKPNILNRPETNQSMAPTIITRIPLYLNPIINHKAWKLGPQMDHPTVAVAPISSTTRITGSREMEEGSWMALTSIVLPLSGELGRRWKLKLLLFRQLILGFLDY